MGNNASQNKGQDNEDALLFMLDEMEKNNEPFPVNGKGGLYVKALWARLSGQSVDDITKAPSWFNARHKCKERLETIKTKLAQGQLKKAEEVVTEKDTALADLMDSSSNKTLQMMKSRMNSLKEKLDSERAERSKLQQDNYALKDELSRLKQREEMILNGKTTH